MSFRGTSQELSYNQQLLPPRPRDLRVVAVEVDAVKDADGDAVVEAVAEAVEEVMRVVHRVDLRGIELGRIRTRLVEGTITGREGMIRRWRVLEAQSRTKSL